MRVLVACTGELRVWPNLHAKQNPIVQRAAHVAQVVSHAQEFAEPSGFEAVNGGATFAIELSFQLRQTAVLSHLDHLVD